MNINEDDFIASIFYNVKNYSIITISGVSNNLKCRSLNILHILKSRPLEYKNIFENINIGNNGFIEFDNINMNVLTAPHDNSPFTLWSLYNYKPLFQIKDNNITDIKIGKDNLMVICKKNDSLYFTSVRIKTGKMSKKYTINLQQGENLLLIEIIGNCLVTKEQYKPLKIYNV